jgi:hypothetical protein
LNYLNYGAFWLAPSLAGSRSSSSIVVCILSRILLGMLTMKEDSYILSKFYTRSFR